MHKFITEESVKKICEKYGLVYGEVSRYKGEVPIKNLKHIEDFKIKEEDECYVYYTEYYSIYGSRRVNMGFYDKKGAEHKKEYIYKFNNPGSINDVTVCPLEIAAPKSDFNMEGLEIKDFKLSNIEIPDPIVLKPVIFKSKKHYLIVTAWGIEASDELVVNPVQN